MEKSLSQLCKECGECCKHIVLPIEKPLDKALFDGWADARGLEVVGHLGGRVLVKIDHPCPHLTKSEEGWICDQYEDRPDGCRNFDGRYYDYLDCKWKKADIAHKPQYVILEKAGGRCPMCNRTGVLLRRFKEGPYWVREFKCSNGHIYREVQ
jgi:Fe-S-cluster containining protein